jgi:acyl carrier protein
VLDALPVTATGKVDRNALRLRRPRPEPNDGVPPSTMVEHAVHDLWAQVLSGGPFPADMGFLDVGGDSLSAMRLLVRARERFGLDLTVGDVLDARTIAGMAAVVERRLVEDSDRLTGVLSMVEAMSEDEAAALLSSYENGAGLE